MTEGGRPPVDVAFLPDELEATEVAIVVDVLRASSTITAALSSGYERVICVDSVEEALALAGEGRVLAGEQDTRPVEGFDLGNSPAELGNGEGKELVLSTTNGTPAILKAVESAETVLVGSLLNLDAVAAAVPAGARVTVVCAGTGGRFSLEDSYAAGRIVQALQGERTDAARAAERLAEAYADPVTALGESAHAAVLRDVGQGDDIAVCARESIFEVVPLVTEAGDGRAVVSASAAPTQTDREALDVSMNA